MKIYYKNGNIFFEGFGGRNFVLPDSSEGDIVLETILMAFVCSQKECTPAIDKVTTVFQMKYLMGQNKK